MGKPKRRASPAVVGHVNRNLESLAIRAVVSAVRDTKPPWRRSKFGRRGHKPRNVAVCCILQVLLGKTYESMEAYLKEHSLLRHLLHVDKLPTHSVLHRGMMRISLPYIRRILRKVTCRLRRQGMTVAVDSSGLSLSSSSKWFDIRIRRKNSKKDFLKIHIVVDVETGVILDFTITEGQSGDSPELPRLLRNLPLLAAVLGDKAYSSRLNCRIACGRGAKPYLRFKVNSTGKAKGYKEWAKAFREYKENPEAWLAVYHLRSIVEAVFGSLKRRWGGSLRSVRGWMRRKEAALKVLAYDIKQVLYNERAEATGKGLWVEA